MVVHVGEVGGRAGDQVLGSSRSTCDSSLSFDDFYSAEYQRIVRLLVASTGRLDLAEEITQDSFLAALRKWSVVSTYDDPCGWVRRVALNAATSAWRRRRTEAAALVTLHRRASVSSPLLDDRDEHVWTLVRRLPARQAQVIVLASVEDRSTADIATILEISENSVRTHLRRARERLASELGSSEEEHP
jgi:RNA polymerase sigma-70 factor, ECF subfamily